MSNINDDLIKMYLENNDILKSFIAENREQNLCGPLLLSVDKYVNQKVKILFIGQETNGWSHSTSVDEQIKTYKRFNFGKNYVSSPFWNIRRKIEKVANIEPHAIAWTNLNRFDVNKGSPDKTALRIKIRDLDFLLKKEIDILKPDVCVFFTNHKYDERIKNLYKNVEFQNIDNLRKSTLPS